MENKVCIIGGGNLGVALTNGLLKNNIFNPENLTITRRNLASLSEFAKLKITVSTDNVTAIREAELIIIAVKPHDVPIVLQQIKREINPLSQCIVSVATGVSIKEIKQGLHSDVAVFRAMPNTAADIGQSITCLATEQNNHPFQNKVEDFFNLIGETILIKEELMEAATVLGACGIAYVLRFIRSMTQGGIQIGFDAKTASQIVNQVVIGAASLLSEKKSHPEEEIDKVTTPKGCTIIGLNEMEHNGFSSSLIKGIGASYQAIEK